ncbi:hypothetical protein R38712_01997 [Ralstonia pickettii]|uniref:Polymerase n=2 Tax=Ralstonia pickettii TaxID=329 RepID=A0ABM9ILV6_RALPI|nr:hypothetical protein R38712_01997 [Ralstonia pickettii]
MCGMVPFVVAPHSYPLPTFYAEFAAGICWIALAVVVLALTWRNKARLPAIALAPFALVGVLFAQLLIAPPLNPSYSLEATVFLLAAAAACGLGARCRNLPGVLEAFAIGLVLGGLATVAVELLQLFRVQGLPIAFFSILPAGTDRRMWGNINQPNLLASYLAFGIAASGFLAHRCRHARIPLALIAVIFLLGMSLAFSRTAWLHIVVLGTLAGAIWTLEQRGWRRWVKACVPALVLLVTYQLCNWLVAYANIRWHLDLPTSMGERINEGVGPRAVLWQHAWHMFVVHPWLGGGWGDYAWNQYLQTDQLGRAVMATNAHNIVLDQLAKLGVLGLLAVALPFLGFVWNLRKRRATPGMAFLLGTILVMGAHSMLEFPLHYLFFLLPFAFALGYLDERSLPAPSSSMAWTLTAVLSVGAAALMSHLWGDYRAVERLNYAPDGPAAEWARYQQHGSTLLLPYEQLVISINLRVAPDMASSLLKMGLQAAQFYPVGSTVQRYALGLAYQGKTDEAVLQIRRLRDEYWYETDYVPQIGLLIQLCSRKNDTLAAFCTRLKSEKLLVEPGAETQTRPVQMSK